MDSAAVAEEVQAQIAALEAEQQKLAQLRAQIAELEHQGTPAELPAAGASATPSAPAEGLVPSESAAPTAVVVPPSEPLPAAVAPPAEPLPAVIPSTPPPTDDVLCLNLRGDAIPCQKPEDLVDLSELVGGSKSINQVFDAIPSWEQLRELDTLLPIVGGLVTLSVGFVGAGRFAEWLRPDDAATARRKREERERLGLSEEEDDNQGIAPETLVAVVLIVGFELALFNLRNL